MEQTERQLEEDEERFHKLQMSDQASFNDKLDTLSMVVAGMAAHTDINRAHEVANEVRRLSKQMKEAQTLASTYNNRERLFGMPITNVRWCLQGRSTPRTKIHVKLKCCAKFVIINNNVVGGRKLDLLFQYFLT